MFSTLAQVILPLMSGRQDVLLMHSLRMREESPAMTVYTFALSLIYTSLHTLEMFFTSYICHKLSRNTHPPPQATSRLPRSRRGR